MPLILWSLAWPALQSCLADSAVYVRYLRRRVLELELQAAQAQRSASEAAAAAAEISAGRAEDESKSSPGMCVQARAVCVFSEAPPHTSHHITPHKSSSQVLPT